MVDVEATSVARGGAGGRSRWVRMAGVVGAAGCAASVFGIGAGTASAMPNAEIVAAPTTVCSTAMMNPEFLPAVVTARLRLKQSGRALNTPPGAQWYPGQVNLELLSSKPLGIGPDFAQAVRFSWRNLNSGRTGVAKVYGSVTGPFSIAYAERVPTGPGRVVVTVEATNRGRANTASSGMVTRGGCVGNVFTVR